MALTSRATFRRVGAGQLVDREGDRRLAVERAGLVVGQGPQLDLGHVAHADQTAVGVGLEDHVGKLLDVDQPSHRAHRELKDLSGATGACPIWPAATCVFCCWIVVMTSLAVRLR